MTRALNRAWARMLRTTFASFTRLISSSSRSAPRSEWILTSPSSRRRRSAVVPVSTGGKSSGTTMRTGIRYSEVDRRRLKPPPRRGRTVNRAPLFLRRSRVHSLMSDIRLAFRRARKRPGFTVVALLSLTLGIGVNTAVFSLVNAILLRRPPIPHPERIAEVYQRQTDFPLSPFSYPDYMDFRRASTATFSQMSISEFTVAARDMGDHVESLMGELVNGDYFPLLG